MRMKTRQPWVREDNEQAIPDRAVFLLLSLDRWPRHQAQQSLHLFTAEITWIPTSFYSSQNHCKKFKTADPKLGYYLSWLFLTVADESSDCSLTRTESDLDDLDPSTQLVSCSLQAVSHATLQLPYQPLPKNRT